MTLQVVYLQETVNPHNQECQRCNVSTRNDMFQLRFESMTVNEARERVVLGQKTYLFLGPLAQRNIAQNGTMLNTVGTLPSRKISFDGKYLPIATDAIKLGDFACALAVRSVNEERKALADSANPGERLTDHFVRGVAEHRGCTRIPNRYREVFISADEAITKLDGDPVKPILRNTAAQSAQVDFIDDCRDYIGDKCEMQQCTDKCDWV